MAIDSNSEQPYVFLPETGQPSEPPPRRPVSTRDTRPNPWPWLLIGIPLGIFGTILVQQALTPTRDKHVFLPVPSASASPVASLTTPVPVPSAVPSAETSPLPTTDPSDFAPAPGSELVPPLFGGTAGGAAGPGPAGNTPQPPPLEGHINMPPVSPLPNISGGGPTGIQPIHPTVEGAKPGTEPTADVALVTLAIQTGETDVDSTESRLAGIAAKYGGSSSRFVELAESKDGDKNAILLVVPMDKKAGASSAIKSMGAAKDEDWNGSPQERANLLEERLALSLHDLQRQKEKLLVKYFDDAGPVKDIDDRIDAARKQLRAVRVKKTPGTVIFRVYVGPNA